MVRVLEPAVAAWIVAIVVARVLAALVVSVAIARFEGHIRIGAAPRWIRHAGSRNLARNRARNRAWALNRSRVASIAVDDPRARVARRNAFRLAATGRPRLAPWRNAVVPHATLARRGQLARRDALRVAAPLRRRSGSDQSEHHDSERNGSHRPWSS